MKMPKGFRNHLSIIGSTDTGRQIGRTSVILSAPDEVGKDAVQKHKAKKVPLLEASETREEVGEA